VKSRIPSPVEQAAIDWERPPEHCERLSLRALHDASVVRFVDEFPRIDVQVSVGYLGRRPIILRVGGVLSVVATTLLYEGRGPRTVKGRRSVSWDAMVTHSAQPRSAPWPADSLYDGEIVRCAELQQAMLVLKGSFGPVTEPQEVRFVGADVQVLDADERDCFDGLRRDAAAYWAAAARRRRVE